MPLTAKKTEEKPKVAQTTVETDKFDALLRENGQLKKELRELKNKPLVKPVITRDQLWAKLQSDNRNLAHWFEYTKKKDGKKYMREDQLTLLLHTINTLF